MNKTCLFVALVVTTTLGSGHALAAPFPADATDSRGAVFGVPDMIATMPFLLGEVDLSTLGVADSELAGVGLAGATNNSPGDGPNMFIVDDDAAECPNAAFSRIQDAVNAAGPGDQPVAVRRSALPADLIEIGPGVEQGAAIRRHNEDTHRIGNLAAHLLGALDVNIEQQILAATFRILKKAAGCPIIVSEDLGIFQELVFGDHPLKFRTRDEVVLPAVLFAPARRTRSVGDRKIQTGDNRAQLVHQRRFA